MKDNLSTWVKKHTLGLYLFNITMMILVLLRTAGYFHPFFLITINFIVFLGLVLSAVLLGVKSSGMYLIAIIFWTLSLFFAMVKIWVWSERSSIYTFDAFVIGTILFLFENLKIKQIVLNTISKSTKIKRYFFKLQKLI